MDGKYPSSKRANKIHMSKLSDVFVAGFSQVPQLDRNNKPTLDRDGKIVMSIAVIVRDKVNRNPMMRADHTKSGSIWIDKGFTIEEVKNVYPYGKRVQGYEWGDQVEGIANTFELNPVDVGQAEEVKEEAK